MELLISAINFIFCIAYYFINKKHLVNPVTLFHALWGFLFFIFSLRFYLFPEVDFIELDSRVSIYYLTFFFMFFLGGILSNVLYNIIPKRPRLIQEKNKTLNLNEKKFYIIRFVAYLAIFFAIIEIFQNDFSLRDYFQEGALIRAAMTEDYNPLSSIFSLISSYFAWIILPACALIIIKTHKRKLWMFLPFVSLFIVSMISIGKYNLILATAIFINMWLLTQNLNIRTLKKVFKPAIAGFLFVVLLFGGSAQLRNNISEEINYSENLFPISFLLFMYGVGHINNFAEYYNNYESDSGTSSTENAGFRNISLDKNVNFGEHTFSGFYRLLYWVGLKEDVSYTRYEGTKDFNTYSILRNYIDDFGEIGSFIAALLTGLFLNFLFLVINKNKISGLISIALIFLFIEYTAIHSLFNFIFFYLVIIFAPLISRLRFSNLRI